MAVRAFEGSQENVIFCSLVLVFTVLSSLSSIIVIYLIGKMKMTNGHSWLIWTMSWFQLIYDLSFFNAVIHVGSDSAYVVANIAQLVGGISSSLTSNVIAAISYYVVRKTRSVDILSYYHWILLGVTLPSIVNSILYGLSCVDGLEYLRAIATLKVYYFIRVASIVFNFIVCFLTYMQIRKISSKYGTVVKRTIPENAIRTLARRLMYYPIIQAVSRSAVAWYEIKYHYEFTPDHVSRSQFVAQCFMALLTPSASFGYLAIFLLMQPNAWEALKSVVCCREYRPRLAGSLAANTQNLHRYSPVNAKLTRAASGSEQGQNSHHSSFSLFSEAQSASALDDSDNTVSLRYSFRMSERDDDELWELIATNNDTEIWNARKERQTSQEFNNITSALISRHISSGGESGDSFKFLS